MVRRKPYIGKMMYAIFWDGIEKHYYVQPCKVVDIDKWGYKCECHNGSGITGNGRCGIEWFQKEDIGTHLFFTFDSATEVMKRGDYH